MFEKTVYEYDNIGYHLIYFIIFTTALIFLKKININPKIINFNRIYIILFALMVIFIMITNFSPKADQGTILRVVDNMYNQNFSDFEKTGYIGRYPHQKGLVIFLFLLRGILGSFNFRAFQIMNVFSFIIYLYCMVNITRILFPKERFAKYLTIFLILFFPVALYTTFVYGNLMGLAFSLLSILFLLKYYFENKKIIYILLSPMFISLAIIFKQNYLIFLIGILVYLAIKIISDKNVKPLKFAALFIIVQLLSSFAINSFLENYTGIELSDGAPSSSYIAMGLQWPTSRAPGWYNAYNENTYRKNNYDTEAANRESIENIKESLKKFYNEPSYALEFFSKKINSQWNNPSFQSFWIGQTTCINRQHNFSPLINNIYFEKTNVILTDILNILQTLILAGALLFVILDHKTITMEHLIFPIIFIGGFIFHIFWEAKAQYTISYFVLLLPYAAKGYNTITDKLMMFVKIYKETKQIKINKVYIISALALIIITVTRGILTYETYFSSENNTDYETYITRLEKTKSIPHGKYIIVPEVYPDYFVNIQNKYSEKPKLLIDDKNTTSVQSFMLTPMATSYTITADSGNVFDVTGGIKGAKDSISLYKKNDSAAQNFEIIPCDDDSDLYYITWYNNYALTLNVDTDMLYIENFSGKDSQKWRFIPIN